MARRTREGFRLRGRHLRGRVRIAIAFTVGIVVYGACQFVSPWQIASLIGWDAAALIIVGIALPTLLNLDGRETHEFAMIQDDSRAAADAVLIGASLTSLVGILLELYGASHRTGVSRDLASGLAFFTVIASWAAVQTIFTFRYARIYYTESGGIDFHADDITPDYRDFLYTALTIGMTYQVSDTDLESKSMRRTAIRQALLSYLFGIFGIAITINVVASLLTK